MGKLTKGTYIFLLRMVEIAVNGGGQNITVTAATHGSLPPHSHLHHQHHTAAAAAAAAAAAHLQARQQQPDNILHYAQVGIGLEFSWAFSVSFVATVHLSITLH